MINKIDLQTEKYIINKYISMTKQFDQLDIDYRINGNMLCPFHQNENTPAAHLYADDNGYRLWCFAESRMYGSWDVYKQYMTNINTNKLALYILNQMTEEQQKKLFNDIGAEQEVEELPFKTALLQFKQSKINCKQLLQNIADTYQDE